MSQYSSRDPYLDPDAGVLKNRFGIADAKLLEEIEADLSAARSRELAQRPIQGRFDLAHLQAIHRYLFGDVYDWAGELRTVDISKGNSHFAHCAYLPQTAASLFALLAKENVLQGLAHDPFGDRIAYYLGELNALHPFRDGNGRAQRQFVSQIAANGGYHIAWKDILPSQLLAASVESFLEHPLQLASLIKKNLRQVGRY